MPSIQCRHTARAQTLLLSFAFLVTLGLVLFPATSPAHLGHVYDPLFINGLGNGISAGGTEIRRDSGGTTPVSLPTQELAPICRTSGQRIVVVFAHPPGYTDPTPVSTLRRDVRRMNWKISNESSLSSNGTRKVKMAVDCTAGGEIQIYRIEVPAYTRDAIEPVLDREVVGYPTAEDPNPAGVDAVKYLIFATAPPRGFKTSGRNGTFGNDGAPYQDASKSRANDTATHTSIANIAGEVFWQNHTTIHEMFHSLGATYTGFQFIDHPANGPPAPYSSYEGHCVDGLDMLCYEDGGGHAPWGNYTETVCDLGATVNEVNLPIDCNKDTYFDAAPESGEWLDSYWNLAGSENPFLAVMPTQAPAATTEMPTSIDSNGAVMQATVTPNADYAYYQFEYGLDTNYGSSAPLSKRGVPGYGNSPVNVSWELSGFSPDTTIHYRVVAMNDAGQIVKGADRAFTTNHAPVAVLEQPIVDPERPRS
ncbi:MAG: hypothetical protein WCC10_13245, partial [Tumebacillaceae bacterium]